MKIAIAQLNPTVGDLKGNRQLVEQAAERAADAGADLLVTSEMVLTGYPPMDLLLREGFVRDQLRELETLCKAATRIPIVLGAVTQQPGSHDGALFNSALLLAGGELVGVRPKSLLPTYDVFDEKRYFSAASHRQPIVLPTSGTRLGLTVCEDTWVDQVPHDSDPVAELAAAGAELIVNPSASPWRVGKSQARRQMFSALARKNGVPIVFVNQVGGNDELIFDGGSCVVGADGRVLAALPLFESALAVVDLDAPGVEVNDEEPVKQLEAGLVLGIRDYFQKQRLPPGAVIGLSGGIDSAVTAHLAVEALGSDQVLGIAMPGPFSSQHSVSDALELGNKLGIEVRRIEIGAVYEAYRGVFAQLFGTQEDYGLTQQNIQSRIRGAILMAVSNQEGRLVLATGNKSELSVGYCTLYGDTVGGLAVLGDVYKRDVYELARFANSEAERIPKNTLDKEPSAELAPNQLDSDDLPSYDILDAVLEQAIEGQRGTSGIESPPGCTSETASAVVRRLDRNEYKRRQTPLVLRTSSKAFGSGRRLPIVHRYER